MTDEFFAKIKRLKQLRDKRNPADYKNRNTPPTDEEIELTEELAPYDIIAMLIAEIERLNGKKIH